MSNLIIQHESLSFVAKRLEEDARSDKTGRASLKGGGAGSWSGESPLNAAKKLQFGDPELLPDFHRQVVEQVESLRDRVNDWITDTHIQRHDVSGGWVDMDRYLSGEPENMVETYLDPNVKAGNVVRILVNVAASSGVQPEVIRQRGIAVAVAVEAAAQLGLNTELWMGQAITPTGTGRGGNGETLTEMLKLKGFHDPLDESVMVWCCSSPAMLRRIIFNCEENDLTSEDRSKWGIGPEGGGYGAPASFPDEVREQFDLVIERGRGFTPEEVMDQILLTKKEDRLNEYQ